MMLRRHVRSGGVVVNVWTAMTSIPNTNIKFIEESLISLRNPTPGASVAPRSPALLQCWYRVHAQESDLPCAKSHGIVAAHRDLLKEHALRLRSNLGMGYIQSLENLLLNEPTVEATGVRRAMLRV